MIFVYLLMILKEQNYWIGNQFEEEKFFHTDVLVKSLSISGLIYSSCLHLLLLGRLRIMFSYHHMNTLYWLKCLYAERIVSTSHELATVSRLKRISRLRVKYNIPKVCYCCVTLWQISCLLPTLVYVGKFSLLVFAAYLWTKSAPVFAE